MVFFFINIGSENILIMSASKFMETKKGNGTVGFVIGIVVLIIIIATVALPIISDATANLTGTSKTILVTSGTLLSVLVIVYIANAM